MFISLDIVISESSLADIPSLLRHATVAISKKDKKLTTQHAFNIARKSLQRNGYLKHGGTKSTQKGTRRNMKHSFERDNKGKNEKFKELFKDITV